MNVKTDSFKAWQLYIDMKQEERNTVQTIQAMVDQRLKNSYMKKWLQELLIEMRLKTKVEEYYTEILVPRRKKQTLHSLILHSQASK